MRKLSIFSLVIAFLLSANLSPAAEDTAGEAKPANYVAVKGGMYSPSNKFDVAEIPGGSTIHHLDNKIGFAGEVAIGHYYLPFLAMELGAGYFESKASGEAVAGGTDARLRVVPVVVTAKALLPLGPVEPYGEFGVGGYFSKVKDFKGHESTNTKAIFGMHAGAGVNFNVTDYFLLGLEGRYIWTENSWGTADAKIDGFVTTVDLGFRY